jgi:hypothetical protein
MRDRTLAASVPQTYVAARDASKKSLNLATYVCDGTSDDVQIQRAIDALPASGGRVELSEGTFTVDGTKITLASGTHLTGAGVGVTTVKLAAAQNGRIITNTATSNNITISDITFDGNESNQTADGVNRDAHAALFLGAITDLNINRVEVKNTYAGAGIRLGTCIGVRISDTVMSANKDTVVGGAFLCDNIFCGDGTNIQIVNCQLGDCSDTGIAMDGSDHVNITGCNILGPDVQSIAVVDSESGTAKNVTITGNILGANGTGGYGVRMFANQGTTSVSITVSGNVFTDCDHGISIESNIHGVVISGNLIKANSGTTKDCIRFVGTPDDVVLTGNQAGSSSLIGVNFVSGTPTQLLFGNNNFQAATTPISGTIPATSTFSGTVAIPDPGDGNAIAVTQPGAVALVTAGAETRTLAAPTSIGQELLIYMKTDGGNCVVTCATTFNETGNNTATFTDTGEAIKLVAVEEGSTLRWRTLLNDGAAYTTV